MSGEPAKILKEAGNAILVSVEVWCGITATLNLLSVPGMRKSIRSGMRKPVIYTMTLLDW